MSAELRLHILTASGRLVPWVREVDARANAAFDHVATLLALGSAPVDVVVRDAPRFAISETGIGGRAWDSHTVFSSVDAAHVRVEGAIRFELSRLLAHELHHVARLRTVGYGRTLGEATISEGLADRFAVEAFAGEPPLIRSCGPSSLSSVMRPSSSPS